MLGLLQDGAVLVRLAMMALDAVVAGLFLRRTALLEEARVQDLLMALPSLVLGGWAFVGSGPVGEWPVAAQALFVAGALWTCASLLALGGSFAVLPALRALVRRGPYRWLRHPAYAGEALLVAACVLAGGPWQALLALAPALVLRVRAEERVLARDPSWPEYCGQVRYRLLPGLW